MPARPPASVRAIDAVVEQLRSYARRGVFREFSANVVSAQRVDFRFVWLTTRPLHAQFDARSSVLKLIDLLPGVERRSPMDRALRDFLKARFSPLLPAHRRLSSSLIRRLNCSNRNGRVSIGLRLNRRRPGEGARQAVLLISEIFQGFLAGPYHEYMVVNFDIRED
jgi:hypothetical protein